MATNTGHVMTLANSIIGVSVLAMPFCFKQCGITLAVIMLILSSVTTRLACHFLVKASSMCKRRNFEFLAFYTFGPFGKLMVELGIIGFMMGTCVAFFVVIGDLGPQIISKILHIKNDNTLRSLVLLVLGFCVVLPLGLLRNIESLAAVSTVTIGFYFLLIVKLFLESFSHLLAGDWIHKVNFWQPEGVLQCIPIFAMALSCQTQIFEIYESLPSPTLDKMNSVVRSAVNICTVVYISVGLLGYIAYCAGNFTGNILLSFAPSFASEMYKLGFVMSIAVSFPLVIFPCRASLYSLIFRRIPIHHELSQTSSYIPDSRFKCLTTIIVGVSMITGMLIPSIELVLGFLGSTIGVAICVIFPTLSFINLTSKETNERITAKITLLMGLVIMTTGSLANFQAATEVGTTEATLVKLPDVKIFPGLSVQKKGLISTESAPVLSKKVIDMEPVDMRKIAIEEPIIRLKPEIMKKPILDQKKEPPFPVAPAIDIKPSQKPMVLPPAPVIVQDEPAKNVKSVSDISKKDVAMQKDISLHEENINKDAIEKEEREMKEIENLKKKEEDQKEKELLQKLKEHQDEQKKLLQEQQKILNAIKNRESEKLANEVADKGKKIEKPVAENVKRVGSDELKESKKIDGNGNVRNDFGSKKGKKNEKQIEKVNEHKQDAIAVQDVEKTKQGETAEGRDTKEDVSKAKIASVPLPLAKLHLQPNIQNEVKNPNAIVQSKQEVMARDILEESKHALSRGKRDAVMKGPGECPVEEEKLDDSNIVSSNKTEKVNREEGEGKNSDVEFMSEPDGKSGNLIKNSQHVSMDLKISEELTIMQGNDRLIQSDPKMSVPKKRDLKSMKTNEKDLRS